jgi:hypothetical protein
LPFLLQQEDRPLGRFHQSIFIAVVIIIIIIIIITS